MNKTILAIDDEKCMLAFYQTALAEFGDVRTAINLEEARKQLPGVDLILLDFFLEKDSDLIQDVVPELKKTAPVLLCSGIQDVEVPALGAALGIAGYWNKGSDHDKLRSLVKLALSRERK
jgi:DNA-binding NtrC family response regulator